jgi:hypothetical protein
MSLLSLLPPQPFFIVHVPIVLLVINFLSFRSRSSLLISFHRFISFQIVFFVVRVSHSRNVLLRTGRADLSWLVPGMHSCLLHVIGRFQLVKVQHSPRAWLARYGTVLIQWYVMHSHERRLPGSMIDDEFEVCFEFLLSVVLAKRRV